MHFRKFPFRGKANLGTASTCRFLRQGVVMFSLGAAVKPRPFQRGAIAAAGYWPTVPGGPASFLGAVIGAMVLLLFVRLLFGRRGA